MATLEIVQMTYPRELMLEWHQSCAMLASSRACEYLKNIFGGKAARRRGTRRFFGEAYVATKVAHVDGYYGSFQWLTSPMFLADRPFPPGHTQVFQCQYRSALHRHFPGQLETLQQRARRCEERTGVRPAAPDLWLVETSGRHRFIEVKLPGDEISDNQIAGLAVIAMSFTAVHGLSAEIVELHPDRKQRFAEFTQHLDNADCSYSRRRFRRG